MILTIYIIILIYFLLGGIGFYFINKRKERPAARENRTKFITYFFIIHILFLSIIFNPLVFHYLAIAIILVGFGELIKLFLQCGYIKKSFFGLSLFLYLILCAGFILFSRMDGQLILFTFLTLSIFDAFSQVSGQLLGKRKIFPAVSPKKTVEGLAGGALIAISSSLLLKDLTGTGTIYTLLLASGVVLSAFFGDMAASFYKREYKAKDFSNLLPGHGGFLDRFDSLIAGGAFVFLIEILRIY
ncbi:MAG: phosphatidate cytidylyltransferase [Bacteroidales bacterium]